MKDKIEEYLEEQDRMQFVMDKYRFHRCSIDSCKSIYSGGLKSCNEVQGQVRKEDLICEKCAGL